jgi:NADP-dependent 3-hydroxy acid dehydrogenase YdfG
MKAPLESVHAHGISGLVAVVTGGGSGIGQIMAKALEHNGAIVYILGRTLEKLEQTASMAVSLQSKPVSNITSLTCT